MIYNLGPFTAVFLVWVWFQWNNARNRCPIKLIEKKSGYQLNSCQNTGTSYSISPFLSCLRTQEKHLNTQIWKQCLSTLKILKDIGTFPLQSTMLTRYIGWLYASMKMESALFAEYKDKFTKSNISLWLVLIKCNKDWIQYFVTIPNATWIYM